MVKMKITQKIAICLLGTICCFFARSAAAYRPFNSTDAAVADSGKSEVELGADYMNNRDGNTVAVPSLRYNYGFAPRWEATLEGSLQVFDPASRNGVQLLASQFDIKGVLLEGPLQHAAHPISLGVELSALLPETHSDSGLGGEGILLAGFRTGKFTWHLNAGGGIERRTLEPLGIWGVIVEHPLNDSLRLALEVNGESGRATPANNSTLLGILWEHRGVTYDAGFRYGLTKAAPKYTFTAGLTFSF
jgi:hypothetical protein